METKYLSEGGGMLDNGNGKWCMLGMAFLRRTGHFCVKPWIFVPNRAFLCRTGFFVSNECYNTYLSPSLSAKITLIVISYISNFIPAFQWDFHFVDGMAVSRSKSAQHFEMIKYCYCVSTRGTYIRSFPKTGCNFKKVTFLMHYILC